MLIMLQVLSPIELVGPKGIESLVMSVDPKGIRPVDPKGIEWQVLELVGPKGIES